MIPNSKVWGDVITNVDRLRDTRRVDLALRHRLRRLHRTRRRNRSRGRRDFGKHPKLCCKDPAPVIRANALGESSVDFVVRRPWVRAADYWDVYWDLTRQVKEAFDARGLTIPFPQTEMRIKGDPRGATPGVSVA